MDATASQFSQATAIAHPNLALVKYWGKRDRVLNLPSTGSISVTLGNFETRTTVRFEERTGLDKVILDGKDADGGTLARVSRLLDMVRFEAGISYAAQVRTRNNFPTASGLASSSSGFAALALASCKAAGLGPTQSQISTLARRGSGSAARSIFGGFVEMIAGKRRDGLDAVASQLYDENYWKLHVVAVLTTTERKPVGSTEAMEVTAASSPYYETWVKSSEADLDTARAAIASRDLEALGKVVESSALKMHCAAMVAQPSLLYWRGGTVEVIHQVKQLRKEGIQAYFTIDAGPHVKVICLPENAVQVREALAQVQGVKGILESGVGGSAHLVQPGEEDR